VKPPFQPDTPITALKGAGPRMAERLQHLAIVTVQDLLFHLPYRYQDRTRVLSIRDLHPGDEASIEAEVLSSEIRFARKRMLLVHVSDGSGVLTLRFFHFSASQQNVLTEGTRLQIFGEVRWSKSGLEIIHPEYRRVQAQAVMPVSSHLTAIYPLTDGVSQQTLRNLVDQVLADDQQLKVNVPEWLPPALLQKMQLPDLVSAIATVHKPTPDIAMALLEQGEHPAQQRLAFEELLAQHLSLRRLRESSKRHLAPALRGDGHLQQAFREALPFQLTSAQQRVVLEIKHDLAQASPMQRLVQGDVGSGKTVVAALAALTAVEAQQQVAVMAPTEILAQQHLQNFQHWLNPLGLNVVWLAGKVKGKAREAITDQLRSGEAQVCVGTQALFQEGVEFHQLGLVIIDEQHRFGVHQRLALRDKGSVALPVNKANKATVQNPHQLIMTATPIPRTLAMTAYADLDCSIIDELPPGRMPVETVVIPDERRAEVMQRVHAVCREGRQAYWVCTLIEESEALQCQTAQDTANLLQEELRDLNVGLVHGRMKAAEKETVMAAFKAGDIQLLVATTVIEVGVDVPNATLMIMENAERLGLSQLHQLRGRVGRGAQHSACVLMYHAPLSDTAKSRLHTMRSTNDGFAVARKDLELRGPGELLGTRQTGMMQFRIADLVRDQGLLPQVSQTARVLLERYPERVEPIIRRWIGSREKYANV
jgi:ATP-dependent DNA helicase RecG